MDALVRDKVNIVPKLGVITKTDENLFPLKGTSVVPSEAW
jgi:hypothetical protein